MLNGQPLEIECVHNLVILDIAGVPPHYFQFFGITSVNDDPALLIHTLHHAIQLILESCFEALIDFELAEFFLFKLFQSLGFLG